MIGLRPGEFELEGVYDTETVGLDPETVKAYALTDIDFTTRYYEEYADAFESRPNYFGEYAPGGAAVRARERFLAELAQAKAVRERVKAKQMRDADAILAEEMAEKRLQAEVDKKKQVLETLGEDNFEDKSVITFTKKFGPDSIEYAYAAIKIGGVWYTTDANSSRPRSWNDLMMFLVSGPVATTRFTVMVPEDNEPALIPRDQ